jgi:hypothetical protein
VILALVRRSFLRRATPNTDTFTWGRCSVGGFEQRTLLVPGAYQRRDRGNQFLHDVCDADVFIHVDGAGMTDEEGNSVAAGSGTTVNDIRWVREEHVDL